MLADTSIIRRKGGCHVLAQRQNITWPNGSTIALHPVVMNGADDTYRRAHLLDGGLCMVFDLRSVCPPLRQDLMHHAPRRDHTGFIDYYFRRHFQSSEEARVRIVNETEIAIAPEPAEHVAARFRQAEAA